MQWGDVIWDQICSSIAIQRFEFGWFDDEHQLIFWQVDGRFVVKTFPGVSHGFAVRYKEEKAEKAAREAWEDIVTFFKKNVV